MALHFDAEKKLRRQEATHSTPRGSLICKAASGFQKELKLQAVGLEKIPTGEGLCCLHQ